MHGVLIDDAGRSIDDATAQPTSISNVILVVPQSLRMDTRLTDGHAPGFIDQGVPVIGAFAQTVIKNTCSTGNAGNLVTIGLLFPGNDDFPITQGDIFHLKPAIILQPLSDISPIHL